MTAMTRASDLPKAVRRRSVAGWFRLVAMLEATSWVGLLIGMYFKYLTSPGTEIGVQIFGPIHGALFVAFLVAAGAAAYTYRWTAGTAVLALLASVLPLATVIFLIWADQTAKLDRKPVAAQGVAAGTASAAADVSEVSRPMTGSA
ncbi:DUF3817 domain-containing protein [Mycolicibacterium thermoresistibile]|nr:DUF3817 domain-containing protein [Mycolicibacterium thermoresistibile]MCV7187981.1 DUF3817 domain-containing protein [Mycolicibacterium thermoresistibile]GAT15211.1 putative uncharacterized protein [Mycolicibacterium thermoresistibile]SNW19316.1 integral membrane protein [Mycolicibacterium thermoresistibile]